MRLRAARRMSFCWLSRTGGRLSVLPPTGAPGLARPAKLDRRSPISPVRFHPRLRCPQWIDASISRAHHQQNIQDAWNGSQCVNRSSHSRTLRPAPGGSAGEQAADASPPPDQRILRGGEAQTVSAAEIGDDRHATDAAGKILRSCEAKPQVAVCMRQAPRSCIESPMDEAISTDRFMPSCAYRMPPTKMPIDSPRSQRRRRSRDLSLE